MLKSILINLTVSIASIFLLFITLEFIVFRYFLIASDMPTPVFVNGVIRYKPGQEGIYRVKNEIEAKFRINANGWNSAHREYKKDKKVDEYRIAVIGDSYIAAFQVNYNQSLAELLEANLGNRYFKVFRFGVDGAPLSQYLHMLREEVLTYNPDLVILNLIHNDFEESYEFKPGMYTSSFMKLKITNDTVSEELKPKQYETPWYGWIREKSATWRYLAIRQNLRFNMLRKLILGEDKDKSSFRANINMATILKKEKNNRTATDYIFRNLKTVCDSNSIHLLMLIDGDRSGIYAGTEIDVLYDEGVLSINKMAALIAAKHKIEFLDLHDVFKKDFCNNNQSFEFSSDGHWNSYAHKLVADTLAEYIRNNAKPRL